MRFSVTLLMDDLGKLLEASPALILKYEQAGFDFPESVYNWLGEGEQILRKSHLPQVAAISALKGKHLAARNGFLDPSFVAYNSNQAKRKTLMAVSALIFNQGQEILGNIYQNMAGKREEALKYIRQMVILVDQLGIIPTTNGVSRAQAITRLFATMQENNSSRTAARHVLTLVNYADALRLIDETLTEWDMTP
jgi:hypothetical protein